MKNWLKIIKPTIKPYIGKFYNEKELSLLLKKSMEWTAN